MHLSSCRRSLGALVLALLLAPAPARAAGTGRDLREDAQAALNSSLLLLRRMLHIGTQDDVFSHAISVSGREATLEFELAAGRTRAVSLRGGRVFVDGAQVGTYAPGGSLDRAWRRVLADGAQLETRALLVALHNWRGPALSGVELAAKARVDEALRDLGVRAAGAAAPQAVAAAARAERAAERQAVTAAAGSQAIRLEDIAALDTIGRQLRALDDAGSDVAEVVRRTPVQLGDVTVEAGRKVDGNLVVYRGGADVFGEVSGSVVALFGDVTYHRGAVIGKDAVSIGGQVLDKGGTVRGEVKTIARADLESAASNREAPEPRAAPAPAMSALDLVFRDVRNIVAVFIAFAMLGFGTVFFGRRHLEIVADTASHSFGRSFVVGLLGQLLLLPTFAMLVVGLVFTLVGILLLPFAAVAYVIAAIVALVGGYLAVAHAVGETFTRRRMAHGAFVRAPNAYGYLFAGLVGLLGLWAAAALTGWMGPVVIVFRVAAVIVTWIAATTGFGAVLLSRAGLRETFSGRHFGEATDEYLWATPPATPTAARMKMDGK
jgi:nucleoid-associated protein YgaU